MEWVTDSENMKHVYTTTTPFSVKVQQYKDKKLISTFDSIKLASAATGIDSSSIVRVCKNKSKHAGGYIWKYK